MKSSLEGTDKSCVHAAKDLSNTEETTRKGRAGPVSRKRLLYRFASRKAFPHLGLCAERPKTRSAKSCIRLWARGGYQAGCFSSMRRRARQSLAVVGSQAEPGNQRNCGISPAHMLQNTYQIRKKPPSWGRRRLYQETGRCIISRAAKPSRSAGSPKQGARKAVSGSGHGGVIRPYQLLAFSFPGSRLGTHCLGGSASPQCEAEPRGRGFPGRSLGTRGRGTMNQEMD